MKLQHYNCRKQKIVLQPEIKKLLILSVYPLDFLTFDPGSKLSVHGIYSICIDTLLLIKLGINMILNRFFTNFQLRLKAELLYDISFGLTSQLHLV